MKKIRLIIDWDGRNYGSCPENEDIACVATSKTLEGVKAEMEDALRQHIAWMEEDGDPIPDEFRGECFGEELSSNSAHLGAPNVRRNFDRIAVDFLY